MKKSLFLISICLTCTHASAFFWDSKIKILCYGAKSVDFIYTYELKDKEIYETVVVPKKETNTGKDELISLTKLEDCTIKDSKNWSCGGKSTYEISGPYRSELHTVFEGRYRYTAGSLKLDFCVKKVQSS
jgi:hypothetical protein